MATNAPHCSFNKKKRKIQNHEGPISSRRKKGKFKETNLENSFRASTNCTLAPINASIVACTSPTGPAPTTTALLPASPAHPPRRSSCTPASPAKNPLTVAPACHTSPRSRSPLPSRSLSVSHTASASDRLSVSRNSWKLLFLPSSEASAIFSSKLFLFSLFIHQFSTALHLFFRLTCEYQDVVLRPESWATIMRAPACVDTAEFFFRCSSPRSGGRPISTQQQDG